MKIKPLGFKASLMRGTRIFREDPNDKGEKGGASKDELDAAKAKLAKSVEAEKSLRERLKAFEEAEAETKRKAEEAETEAQRKAGEFAKIEEGLKKRIATLESENASLVDGMKATTIDAKLTAELEAQGVTNPAFKKAALTMLKASNGFDVTKEGDVIDKKGNTPLTDFVKTWAGTDEGKSFITNGNGGGGAPGKSSDTGQSKPVVGNLTGTREERAAYMAQRFPDLPSGKA
jgi:hypothetical protein